MWSTNALSEAAAKVLQEQASSDALTSRPQRCASPRHGRPLLRKLAKFAVASMAVLLTAPGDVIAAESDIQLWGSALRDPVAAHRRSS
jgi:hypothetical protein